MSTALKRPLGELLSEVRSGFASGEDIPDGIVQFRMNNVDRDGRVDLSTKRRVPAHMASDGLLLRVGDILLNATNSPELVGKTAYFAGFSEPVTFSNHFLRLRTSVSELEPKYLAHFLQWSFSRGTFQSMTRQWVNQASLNKDQLVRMQIPLPLPEEQRRIAAILDQAEALRAKRRQALAKLDTLTQSLFLEMFGSPEINPRGWRTSKLSSVCELITDGEHLTPRRSSDGFKLLSARNIRNGFLDFSDVDHVDDTEFARITTRCRPQRDDILISCSGSIGRVSSVRTDEPLSLVRSAALIRPKQDEVLTDYLEAWLMLPWMTALMIRRANASSQANLFQKQIRELPVFVPDLKLQSCFVSRCKLLYEKRAVFFQSSLKHASLFQSLQHQAFQGTL